LELLPGVEKPEHNCTHREIQNLGNLLMLQVFQILKHDHSAMFRKKLCKGRILALP
jgi:hypothetical protein